MSMELLGERLVAGGFLTSEQRDEIVAQQLTFIQAGYHVPFGHIAVMMDYIRREDVETVARGQHRENVGEVLQSAIGVLAISVGLTGVLPQVVKEIPSLPVGTLLQTLFGSLSVITLPLFFVGSTAAVASVLSTRDIVVEEGGSAWEVILPHSLGWVFYTTLLLWLIHVGLVWIYSSSIGSAGY